MIVITACCDKEYNVDADTLDYDLLNLGIYHDDVKQLFFHRHCGGRLG